MNINQHFNTRDKNKDIFEEKMTSTPSINSFIKYEYYKKNKALNRDMPLYPRLALANRIIKKN